VPESRISEYVNDKLTPSTKQLGRLLGPFGLRVDVVVSPVSERREVRRRWLLHEQVVRKLRTDPPDNWRPQIRQRIDRYRSQVRGPYMQQLLDRWEQLLEQDDQRLFDGMLRLDETGDELRNLSPFVGILSEDERLEVLERSRAT
jgi:hypothetical protein